MLAPPPADHEKQASTAEGGHLKKATQQAKPGRPAGAPIQKRIAPAKQ
ncbi:MAG TPA: hypothetical protein VMF69_27185 [Gemmataceae bacterium]|nr:hypothetical protein [Gemmataceae bacterium]